MKGKYQITADGLTVIKVATEEDPRGYPIDDTMPEWEVYQAWLTEGNTPVPLPPPPVSIPATIQLWQARAILIRRGLFDTIDAYVNSHKADVPELYEAWNYGNQVSRDGLFVNSLAGNFNLTQADLDQLFIDGAALKA